MHVHHAISYILYTLHGTDGDGPAASAVVKRKQRVHASGPAPIHTSLTRFTCTYNFVISMTEDMEMSANAQLFHHNGTDSTLQSIM